MKRPPLTTALQTATERIVRGGVKMFLEEHREELLQFLKQADSERARALLYGVCERSPIMAGVVTLLMNGTPEQAAKNIAVFDPELAEAVKANMGTFRRLQEAWARGEENQ